MGSYWSGEHYEVLPVACGDEKCSRMIWECFFMYGKCTNRQPAFETMADYAAICLDSLLSGSLTDSDNEDLLLAELKDIVVKKTKRCPISRK